MVRRRLGAGDCSLCESNLKRLWQKWVRGSQVCLALRRDVKGWQGRSLPTGMLVRGD